MFQFENPEEKDWIMVFDGFEEFEVSHKLKCDLCDRSIPCFVLCQKCKTAQNKMTLQENVRAGICQFCEKEVSVLYSCDRCSSQLCFECKLGDETIPGGINCCEVFLKTEEEQNEKEEVAKIATEEEQQKITFGKSPVVKPEHLKLFGEFLELR